MLDQATRTKIVSDLFETYQTRKGLPLLSKAYPGIEVEDAYRIQEAFVAQRVAKGARIKGYKVGLTSKAMQNAVNINEHVILTDFLDGPLQLADHACRALIWPAMVCPS